MTFATWCIFIGGLLVLMGLSAERLKSLPVSAAAVYLTIGYLAGPQRFGLFDLDLQRDSHLVEMVTEVAVLVSLFAVGLRLRIRQFDRTWIVPILLATVAMSITIGIITATALALQWSLGAAVLLAAVLAPTDPVLASEVQVRHEKDRDSLRFGLTAEGGLNDGAAFPFVMLGLGLLGAHDLGTHGLRWWGVDVLWAIAGGLALGWSSGAAFTRLVIYLRREKQQALGMESFLALGLIAVTYGIAIHAAVYGFLAVFMAGLAMRDVQYSIAREASPLTGADGLDPVAVTAEADAVDEPSLGAGATAPPQNLPPEVATARTGTKMTRLVLEFAQGLESFVELVVMLLIGSLLSVEMLTWRNAAVAGVLLCVARPVAVLLTTLGSHWSGSQRRLGAWFGVRGVGSLYYLAFAATHGMPSDEMKGLGDAVLLTVAASVFLHGVSATPLMALYQRRQRRRDVPVAPRTG